MFLEMILEHKCYINLIIMFLKNTSSRFGYYVCNVGIMNFVIENISAVTISKRLYELYQSDCMFLIQLFKIKQN